MLEKINQARDMHVKVLLYEVEAGDQLMLVVLREQGERIHFDNHMPIRTHDKTWKASLGLGRELVCD